MSVRPQCSVRLIGSANCCLDVRPFVSPSVGRSAAGAASGEFGVPVSFNQARRIRLKSINVEVVVVDERT